MLAVPADLIAGLEVILVVLAQQDAKRAYWLLQCVLDVLEPVDD